MMNVLDIWAVLTGLASLVSLLFYLNERYSHLRKYVVPTGWASAGFAVGRITGILTPQFFQSFQDTRLLGILLILSVIFGTAIVFLIILSRAGQHWFAYMVLVLAFVNTPFLITSYLNANPPIPATDYLKLAKVKEQSGDLAEAIRYLELYANKTQTPTIKAQIDKKITALTQQQMQKDLKGINTK